VWSENREGDPGWEKILKDGRDVNGVGTNEGSWACHMQRLPLSQHITTHKLTKRWNGEAISKKNAATLEAGWELKSNSYKSTSVQKIMAIDQYIYIYIYKQWPSHQGIRLCPHVQPQRSQDSTFPCIINGLIN